MKGKVYVKGQEYNLIRKVGLADKSGNFIIPKEYDRIEIVADNLFAAIEERSGSGILTTSGLVDRGDIDYDGMIQCWRYDSRKKDVAQLNIDFYTVEGKLQFNKKILAYYYSSANEMLILLDENYLWNIATVDYDTPKISLSLKKTECDFENKEIKITEYDADIKRIKETADGKIIFEKDGTYEFIWNSGCIRFGPLKFKSVEPYERGYVAVTEKNKYGFGDYSLGLILSFDWDDIIPKKDYIEVVSNVIPDGGKAHGIYSYSGEVIVPCDYKSIHHKKVFDNDLFIAKSIGIEGNIWYEIYSQKGTVNSKNYSFVDLRENGRMIYCLGGKYGMSLYDEKMNGFIEIIPGTFDFIKFAYNCDNLVCVQKGEKYALYDLNGTQVRRFKRKSSIPSEEIEWYIF